MNLAPATRNGLAAALTAYVCWGLLPLYFYVLGDVPLLELVGWRVVFTMPVCLAIIRVRQQGGELRAAFANPRLLAQLLLSALLICSNWLIFLLAINNGQALATSLGYYINPLMNVLLGTLLLGERLSRVQWAAVALAGAGIALLLAGAVETLVVALSLACSFTAYGFVRKHTQVSAVPGLTIETTLLLVPAVIIVILAANSAQGTSMASGGYTPALIMGTGIATAIPLMLFAVAARALPLSTLGFVQFLSPTISFVLGLTVFGETLDTTRLACFGLIWAAIALYSWDMLRRSGQTPA
jgi:chloramphenicol-sensitive protein RarD